MDESTHRTAKGGITLCGVYLERIRHSLNDDLVDCPLCKHTLEVVKLSDTQTTALDVVLKDALKLLKDAGDKHAD